MSLAAQPNAIALFSPFIIIAINFAVAMVAGNYIGKWAFIPIILIEWCLFVFFVWRYAGIDSIRRWLARSEGGVGWTVLAIMIGLSPLPIFLMHYKLLAPWQVWMPWLILALVNPWFEEFYWRGLLQDQTKKWSSWIAIPGCALLFSVNHAAFGVNSNLLAGKEILISTFVMGLIWALIYKKTNSLRWAIASHFLVDVLSLSAPSFLDLYKAMR
jgi:uncharacterized protein